MQVAADLLGKGFSVFRSMSPSCPCDLVVMCGLTTWTLEVKMGTRPPHGHIRYTSAGIIADYVAVVVDGDVFYKALSGTAVLGGPTLGTLLPQE